MDKQTFIDRLAQLRIQKGVSAREMSLSIGQSPSYINNIENGINLPSMTVFFYICEYLNVSPCAFFDTGSNEPQLLGRLTEDLKQLNSAQLKTIAALVHDLLSK